MWRAFVPLTVCVLFFLGAVPGQLPGQVLLEQDQASEAFGDWSVDWSRARRLSPGIEHERWELRQPRPLVVHCLRVDPRTAGLGFHTTGRIEEWNNGITETRRQTVRDFLRAGRQRGVPLVVAINADAFTLTTAYDREDPCDLLGLAIAGGTIVSFPSGSPSLLVRKNGELTIETLPVGAEVEGIELAVSGFALCLEAGRPLPGGADLNPRTGFGLSAQGEYLFLMTVDGRQPASGGVTTGELGKLLLRAGAQVAINMDGGGSTTLAWWNPDRPSGDACELLNQPVGDGRPWVPGTSPNGFRPTERTNGNNFGISLEVP